MVSRAAFNLHATTKTKADQTILHADLLNAAKVKSAGAPQTVPSVAVVCITAVAFSFEKGPEKVLQCMCCIAFT